MWMFLIKKTFLDIWDNLFKIFLLNLGFVSALIIFLFFPRLFYTIPLLFYTSIIIGIFILFIYTDIVSGITKEISDYKEVEVFRNFFNYLKKRYFSSFIFSILFLASLALILTAFQLNVSIKSPLKYIAISTF
ncbi:hypothetical protein ES703_86391 [subsurface metagenome]